MSNKRPINQHDELEQDAQTLKRLDAAWNQVEQWSEGHQSPSAHHFMMMLEQQRKQMKRKLWRDLSILWCVAIVVLAVGYWIAEQSLHAFILLQLALFGVGLIGAVWTMVIVPRWRRGHSHE